MQKQKQNKIVLSIPDLKANDHNKHEIILKVMALKRMVVTSKCIAIVICGTYFSDFFL